MGAIDRATLAASIDHTLLDPNVRREGIVRLCEEARACGAANVCVNPYRISTCREELEDTSVGICGVISFPFGAGTPTMKMREAYEAVSLGAGELEVVMNIGAVKDAEYDYVRDEIGALRQSLDDVLIKVVLETGYLMEEEVRRSAEMACEGGANLVVTSTGYGPGEATAEDVRVLRESVGREYGVKAAGDIRTYEKARELLEAGASRIGTSHGVTLVDAAPGEE